MRYSIYDAAVLRGRGKERSHSLCWHSVFCSTRLLLEICLVESVRLLELVPDAGR